LKDADDEGIPIVIIVGTREIEQGMVSLRIMKTRKQVPVKICDVTEKTRKLLRK
jgi:histidyl-tRNA synthetase